MKNNILFMLRLISSALSGGQLPKADDSTDWNMIYDISMRHMVTNIIAYPVAGGGYAITQELKQKFTKKLYERIYVSENQNNELSILIDEFNREGIEYLPLKGAILQDLYPNRDMRSMVDVDILIKTNQYEKIAEIMEKNGYTFSGESDHEYNFHKKPFIHVELHKHVIPSYNDDMYAYFGDGWKLAKKSKDNAYGYEYSAEDNFVYIMSHFAKHYRDGGIGIKHVADIWLYLEKYTDMNKKYVEEKLQELGILEFYHNLVRMINAWFKGMEFNSTTASMTSYIIDSGNFGTLKNFMSVAAIRENRNIENAERFRYLKFIFPDLAKMKNIFPVLEKYPFLLPVMWVWRVLRLVLFRRDKISKHRASVESIEQASVNEYSNHMKDVGLDVYNGRRS